MQEGRAKGTDFEVAAEARERQQECCRAPARLGLLLGASARSALAPGWRGGRAPAAEAVRGPGGGGGRWRSPPLRSTETFQACILEQLSNAAPAEAQAPHWLTEPIGQGKGLPPPRRPRNVRSTLAEGGTCGTKAPTPHPRVPPTPLPPRKRGEAAPFQAQSNTCAPLHRPPAAPTFSPRSPWLCGQWGVCASNRISRCPFAQEVCQPGCPSPERGSVCIPQPAQNASSSRLQLGALLSTCRLRRDGIRVKSQQENQPFTRGRRSHVGLGGCPTHPIW